MKRLTGPTALALVMAAFLASLSFVAWRQGRALEVLGELEQVQQQRAVAEAEKVDLTQRIRVLESRGRIEEVAGELFGMRPPTAEEMVFIQGDSN